MTRSQTTREDTIATCRIMSLTRPCGPDSGASATAGGAVPSYSSRPLKACLLAALQTFLLLCCSSISLRVFDSVGFGDMTYAADLLWLAHSRRN
jgi:hypothetical protein